MSEKKKRQQDLKDEVQGTRKEESEGNRRSPIKTYSL